MYFFFHSIKIHSMATLVYITVSTVIHCRPSDQMGGAYCYRSVQDFQSVCLLVFVHKLNTCL